ncbi:MAG: hypothetical protein GX020_00400 [Firmicutes bacterium]|nr:hypothetical protein [Bacillota bacterium]
MLKYFVGGFVMSFILLFLIPIWLIWPLVVSSILIWKLIKYKSFSELDSSQIFLVMLGALLPLGWKILVP